MRDLLKSVAKAADLFNLHKQNWNGTKAELENYIAKQTEFKSRTTMRRAFSVAQSGNEEVIDLYNTDQITLNEAENLIKKEPNQLELAYAKLEQDEEEASQKILDMYEQINDLKYEISVLKRNPTTEEFNKEKNKRIDAETALFETREFLMNHPSGINPESIQAEQSLSIIEQILPDKNTYATECWSRYDKYKCFQKTIVIINKLSLFADSFGFKRDEK